MATYGSDWNTPGSNTYLASSEANQNKFYFRCLKTIHLAALHLLLSLGVFIAAAAFELQWTSAQNCQPYFDMLYIRCVYWILTLIFDIIITRRHNELRRYGYHEFYRKKILNYKNVPFNIVTLWNMIMFVIQTVMQQVYGADFPLHCQKSIKSPITYLCIFCGLETILLIFIHGTYIMKVAKFNRITCLPDALRDTEQPFIGTIGITIENDKMSELLEKQADLIYFLKETNHNLNKKILDLSQQVKASEYHSCYNSI